MRNRKKVYKNTDFGLRERGTKWNYNGFPLSVVLFSADSVTWGQPQSKTIRYKISKVNNS